MVICFRRLNKYTNRNILTSLLTVLHSWNLVSLKGWWLSSIWIMLIFQGRKIKWNKNGLPSLTDSLWQHLWKASEWISSSEINSASNVPGEWRMDRLMRQWQIDLYFSTASVCRKAENKWMKKHFMGICNLCVCVWCFKLKLQSPCRQINHNKLAKWVHFL